MNGRRAREENSLKGEEGNAILRVLRYTLTGIAALPLLDPTDRQGGMLLDTEFGVTSVLQP